ncbi:DUF6344 domain-containing protein [Streptomyces sp. NPDC127106]|uniref:DUF6344 domain-containing protein n=1 Tax=Streptomyces sp. NPDC127106 TaxID=3345360 RepID=UPI003627F05F
MAQRITPSSVWTVVVAVLAALLSALGLRGKAAAEPAVAAGAAPSRGRSVEVCRPAAPRSRRAVMRSGVLPPTIKQRIRAEAHGGTPSVRRSVAAAAAAARAAGEGAPIGAAVRVAPRAAGSAWDGVAATDVRLRLALAA